jgi:hypothetical protein
MMKKHHQLNELLEKKKILIDTNIKSPKVEHPVNITFNQSEIS